MTSWLQHGRSTILDAVADACRRIDEEIKEELETANLKIENACKERDDALQFVSELQAENARLKTSLKDADARKTTVPNALDQKEPDGTIMKAGWKPPNDGINWKAECAKVSLKFNALSGNFKKAKDALRKRKDERDRWIDHATLLERKIKTAEEEHRIQILDRGSRSERATSHPGPTADATKLRSSLQTSFTSEGGLEQTDLELPPLAAESLQSEDSVPAASTTATNLLSESTQGDVEPRQADLPTLPPDTGNDAVKIKEEPSSDGPVIVSERAVRKRKRDEPDAIAAPARKVKMEADNSSSPVLMTGPSILDLQESIDLGDVAQKIMTPRKRKELEDWQRRNEQQTNFTTTSVTTLAPLYVRPDPFPQTARPLERNSALTPVSVNRRIPRSGGDKLLAPLTRGLSHGISVLTEDGDIYKKDIGPTQQMNSNTTNPAARSRLESLLNSPAGPEDSPLLSSVSRNRERPSVLGGVRLSSNELPIPGRRELPFEKEKRQRGEKLATQSVVNSPRTTVSPWLAPQDPRSSLASKKAPATLLRNKPPSELRVDDFKINPQANEGHDFAFSEVVRDREERACLPGCTDMHCCGKQFRALALSQRPDPPLTPTQRQEEQRLLEEYLGDYSYRLATMSKEERDGLWVEAKTQELANKYGKHRHRFSRMRSPPGFWNADFPDTQELEADKAEASKRERQAVQERYREAMRPGGRWMFRDE